MGVSEINGQFASSMFEAAEKLVLEGMEKEKNMPIVWEPCIVEELHGVEVVDIACGLDHSLVHCRNGTLLSCGSNVYGQLGRVKQDLGMLPVDISFVPVSITAGLGHSLAICKVASSDVIGDNPSVFHGDGVSVVSSEEQGQKMFHWWLKDWLRKFLSQFQDGVLIPRPSRLSEKCGFGAAVRMAG